MFHIIETHNKDENGRTIQDILKDLYVRFDSNKDNRAAIITVDLKKVTSHNSADADRETVMGIYEHTTKQMLGYVPKEKIKNIKHNQMTGFIHKDSYMRNMYFYCRIDTQQAPTSRQYQFVKGFCSLKDIDMPAYDIRAYKRIFELYAITMQFYNLGI